MVDKIDPSNQTSVEYGQSLLERKFEVAEREAKDAKKDRKINYAMQVLGGVDNLIKDRYARNVAERNAGLDQDIIRERAEFNRLQKIYDEQAEYRKASSPYALAQQKATAELLPKYGDIANLPLDSQTRIDYNKAQKELTNVHYDRYINNKITMPYDTAEEYTAELEALKNKRVPSGLLDSVLRKTGLRKKDARGALDLEMSTKRGLYADKLAERKSVKGGIDDLTDEMKAAYLGAPLPSPDVTTEKLTTIKNGRGDDVTVTAVSTKDALGNTEITGVRGLNGKVIPISQFVGVTKKQAEDSFDEAKTKILLMEGNEDLTPRGIQKYIYDNPKEFPNLAVHMKVHDLHLPRIKAFDSKDTEQLKYIAGGVVGNLEKDAVYGKYYKAMNTDQLRYLQGGILQSIEWYNTYGVKGKDGQIIDLKAAEILQMAQAEQLQGLKDIQTSRFGDPLVTYEMVQPGSLSTSFEDKSDAFFVEKEDGSFESTAPKDGQNPPQFEDLQPKEEDTADTLRSKGTHIINKLVASPEFDNASFAERRSYVEKIKKTYGTEFDVPYNLLNPSATPMVDEVDDVAEQVAALRGERPEGVQLELTGDEDFDAVRAADEMLLADEGPTIQDAQDFLNPSRPEFKELTREEEKQQSTEQRARDKKENEERRARDKKERDDRIASNKKEMAYRLSPEGKKEIKIAREKREKEILEEYGLTPEKLYDNLIDPDRHDLTRIQSYVDGRLSKNRKIGSTKGIVGKVLKKYELENMTRPEIKEWLGENSDSLLARKIKTKYSPSDIQDELDKGNPVFVGDYRKVTK